MRETMIKRLLEPCRPHMTRHCPTMDLVATATGGNKKEAVEVWRRNGQRVFTVAASEAKGHSGGDNDEDSPIHVMNLVWRQDGKMLAVQWSNGLVIVVDAYNGKAAHALRVRDEDLKGKSIPDWSSSPSVQRLHQGSDGWDGTLSWQSHFAHPAEVKRSLVRAAGALSDIGNAHEKLDFETLMGKSVSDVRRLLRSGANLPRELSRIEIDVALPKLSTLPAAATGADDEIFSTRHSIDMIFHAANDTSNEASTINGHGHGHDMVDVLLTNLQGCEMHVSMYDSFLVGKVDASAALPRGFKGIRIVQDASHPLLTTHYLVLQAINDGPSKQSMVESDSSLHLVALDLRFITSTGYNLPLLATKATQLQNLLRYLTQVSTLLSAEIRTAFDLPSRFVESINESLAEDGDGANFMTQAYHLIVTGTCSEKFKDWLVDQIGDRGLKRWEKAVGDCLDMIRRMTSECLLPAIERSQIVVSRLDGLSRFSDTAARLGLDDKSIRAVREVLDVLNILCQDMLTDVCLEVREFAAFMRWLKWETEVQTLGEDSERADEMRESYTGEAEIRIVLDYIESAMKTSRVMRYLRADPSNETPSTLLNGSDLTASYKKARRSTKFGDLPKLSDLLQALVERCQKVFDSTAETLRKNVLLTYVSELPDHFDPEVMVSSIAQPESEEDFSVQFVSRRTDDPMRMTNLWYRPDTRLSKPVVLAGMQEFQAPESSEIKSLAMIKSLTVAALTENSGNGERRVVCYRLSGLGGNGRVHHVFASADMGSGMRPGELIEVTRKDRDKLVVMDGDKLGFVVLEEE